MTDCPTPAMQPGTVLVRTQASVISTGTEQAQNRETRLPLLIKAWQRPDLAALVLQKWRQDGLQATRHAVRNRLNRPLPAGYSCAGIVEAVAPDITDLQIGQLVACGGIGHARHAQWNVAPHHLVCPVPGGVSADNAAFATLTAIALHALRQGEVTIGCQIAVIGCGLIGQLVVETATAAGARVMAIDPQAPRCDFARQGGAPETSKNACSIPVSEQYDAVLICAPDPDGAMIDQAARLCRDRAVIVCVGNVAIRANRDTLYRKDITIRQVRSYGPGRYDPQYEQDGIDYPIGYVRWTINRNMQTALDLMARGRINPSRLITHRLPIQDAARAFELANPTPLAILIEYPDTPKPPQTASPIPTPKPAQTKRNSGIIHIGLIGAGNYAGGVLVPHLRQNKNIRITAISSPDGLAAQGIARQIGDSAATSNNQAILNDPDTDAVIITTRHNSHADLTVQALEAGKHVWVEKPLCLDLVQFESIQNAHANHPDRILMVGHNRRHAPMAQTIRNYLPNGPKHFTYHVRIHPLPAGHWLHHRDQGGRVFGEISHFVDLLQYLANNPIQNLHCHWINRQDDICLWRVIFQDGSVGDIHYGQAGHRSIAKERLEIVATDTTIILTNWQKLHIRSPKGNLTRRHWLKPDKGHTGIIADFIRALSEDNTTDQHEITLYRHILNALANPA
ncbi:MAG: bi-domain-containing oxidoreductase [Pseudomonadota bacterium]